jgi:uncharacterized protein
VGFERYHEPASELSEQTRTFACMIVSMIEESDAITWYEQRISLERDQSARAIMEDAQHEECPHFVMDLEWLSRHTPKWKVALQQVLFRAGDITENKERGEGAIARTPENV